jgi:hypothetical protein
VHFEGKAVAKVDLNNINSELVGKSRDQANEILRNKADVERIEITLAPSWQKNFPWFKEKIEVRVAE